MKNYSEQLKIGLYTDFSLYQRQVIPVALRCQNLKSNYAHIYPIIRLI